MKLKTSLAKVIPFPPVYLQGFFKKNYSGAVQNNKTIQAYSVSESEILMKKSVNTAEVSFSLMTDTLLNAICDSSIK